MVLVAAIYRLNRDRLYIYINIYIREGVNVCGGGLDGFIKGHTAFSSDGWYSKGICNPTTSGGCHTVIFFFTIQCFIYTLYNDANVIIILNLKVTNAVDLN
jgi:hypothetical protein